MKKVVLILSGGLDSSILGFWLKKYYSAELICITFDYGQKHRNELNYAKNIVQLLQSEHHLIDLSFIKNVLMHSNSSLVNPKFNVPHGEYTKQNMQSTVVPNRNSLMLTIAWTIACTNNATAVAYGAHTGDHYLYPDTRPEYFQALNNALKLGTEDVCNTQLKLIAPFINYSKSQIVLEGVKLHFPFELTWTCYEGGNMHCGICGACISRKQSFIEANVTDPTKYQIN